MVFNLTNIHIFTMWLFSDVGMAHSDFPISNEFYTPTTCFLTFNLCAVVGNLMSFVRFVSLDCIEKSGFSKSVTKSYYFSLHPVGLSFRCCWDSSFSHSSCSATTNHLESNDFGLSWCIGIMPIGGHQRCLASQGVTFLHWLWCIAQGNKSTR